MTYQEQFMRDKYAQIATQIGHQRRKPAAWMHKCARNLMAADSRRFVEKGKRMTDDHLRQVAAKGE